MTIGAMMTGMMIGKTTGFCARALKLGLLGAVLAWGVGTTGVAFAQDIQLEDVVTAEIEMPEAFYVLRASQLHYEEMEPRESFLPELYETVEKEPF